MPGLLNVQRNDAVQPGAVQPRGAQPGAAQPGAAAQPGDLKPADAEADNEGNVSPEEQTQYNEFVTNGMSLLHDEKGLSGLLKAMKGDGNPVEGLANTVASIVIRVEDSAQKQGVEISGDVLMHGGTELLEQAAELAEKAGAHEFSDKDLESALYLAMDIYRTTRQQQGKLPTEQFGQDMQELQAAEQGGALEEMFPGIGKYAEQHPTEAPDEGQPQPGQQPAQRSRGLLW